VVLKFGLPGECTWAREAASARIDDELAELESLRLDRHLRACPACFAQVAGMGSVAIAIRSGALEQPTSRVFTPRRPRRPRRIGPVAVGAGLVLGAVSLGLVGLPGGSPGPVPAAIAAGDAPSARADATEQRLLARLWSAVEPPQGRMDAV
jgi:anti-sigma factor RsiW